MELTNKFIDKKSKNNKYEKFINLKKTFKIRSYNKYFLFPKVKNIYYTYHLSNFLAGLVQNQKNLNLKYTYFYTTFLYKIAKSLENLGLIAGVKITLDESSHIISSRNKNSMLENKKNKFFIFHLFHYKLFLNNFKETNYYKFKNYSLERPLMSLYLKYNNEKPLIHSVKNYSSPGRRLNVGKYKLSRLVYSNTGSFIFLSSSRGIIDHSKALSLGIGGTLLYKIN